MSFINAYCVDEVTILKWNGYDQWNEPLSGEVITVKGYVEWKTRLVRDIKGENVNTGRPSAISPVTVYLPKKIDKLLGRELLHEDRIIIGSGFYDRSILDIRKPKAFSGPHYEVVLT